MAAGRPDTPGPGNHRSGTMAAESTVQLRIPSEIRMVDVVHAVAERLAEAAGFAEDGALDFALAVREATINACVHGNRERPDLAVEVGFRVRAGSIAASVKDRGAGFDPGSVADPTAKDRILETTGRGLLMAKAFVDRVEFRKPPDGGMEVSLEKRLADAAPTGPE